MKGIIAWFTHNSIAANLLMVLIIVGGITTIPTINKEFFPERKINLISISMVYPGAGPFEVEQQICRRIEDAIDGVNGIKEVRSTAYESYGETTVEIKLDSDSLSVFNEVKSRVDAITTFPNSAENLVIREIQWSSQIMSIGLAGAIGEANLKELGEQIREELLTLPHVPKVNLNRPRAYEIGIEISEEALRRYGLRFAEVAAAIRGQSIDLPAGKLLSTHGDVHIQARGQAYTANQFGNIVLLSDTDGTIVRLRDVATIIDGFEELDIDARFNGLPSLTVDVYLTNNPNISAASGEVHEYIDQLNTRLPEGVVADVWFDMNRPFQGRLETLFNNGLSGLILVFILLLLFLRPKVAAWVAVGILVAFLGAIWFLPVMDSSFNIISLFAFILILGIVVDDAIIVGESIYTQQQKDPPGPAQAVRGTIAVIRPVFFAVVSTIIVFSGFFLMSENSPEALQIAKVVVIALAFSLLESLLILPCHLRHMPKEKEATASWHKALQKVRLFFHNGMQSAIQRYYIPLLQWSMHHKWVTFTFFTLLLALPISYFNGGWIEKSFFPRVPGNIIVATVKMPKNSPFKEVSAVAQHVETQLGQLRKETPYKGYIKNVLAFAYSDTVRIIAALKDTSEIVDADDRPFSNQQFAERWKELIGDLPQARDYEVRATIFSPGKPIELEVQAPTIEMLSAASEDIIVWFKGFNGVHNVRSDLDDPKAEIELSLKPYAETLGISLADVSREVRRGFYGEEVQKIPRLREDVRVMVRYPRSTREDIGHIYDMRIRTLDGREIPFEEAVAINYRDSYTEIKRIDRKRVTKVTAEVLAGISPYEITQAFFAQQKNDLIARYPGLDIKLAGEQEEQQEFQARLLSISLAIIIIIYALMAVVFHSYWQPLLIVSAIPFGFLGAIIGHILFGREFSLFSMLGLFACAGVVINDNLVLVDRINILRKENKGLWDAIVQGGRSRFRAIVLTSLTTFVGLLPILFNPSIQAKFLIPMVLSLSFGVLFASGVTLFFVPSMYLIGENFKQRISNWRHRRQQHDPSIISHPQSKSP